MFLVVGGCIWFFGGLVDLMVFFRSCFGLGLWGVLLVVVGCVLGLCVRGCSLCGVEVVSGFGVFDCRVFDLGFFLWCGFFRMVLVVVWVVGW